MNRSFGVAMIVLLVAALAAGCAKNRSPAAQSDQVTIVVDNQNFYDATVYLRWYGDRRRLGDVGGFSRKGIPDAMGRIGVAGRGTAAGGSNLSWPPDAGFSG